MKTIVNSALGALILATFLTTILAHTTTSSTAALTQTIHGEGFAVIELFTSEGCSSCPRADELLAKVQQEIGNKPVYLLAYHVDYWDHQGWRDIFSSPDYTKRQHQYAASLNTQIYTPQVVVNGKTEFVGSDSLSMKASLAAALSGTPASTLILHGKQQSGKLTINYQVPAESEKAELVITVLQKNSVRYIKRGENQGRTIHHAQVVRSIHTFSPSKSGNGQVTISLPQEFTVTEWEVIGLLQDPQTRVIHEANRVELEPLQPSR